MTILERINKEIEAKAKKFGLMGKEVVTISLKLKDEEMEEFRNTELDARYNFEIEGEMLHVLFQEYVDCRELNVTFNKSGGTSTAITTRLTIPKSWFSKMGIDQDDRTVTAIFDGEKIIIKKAD